MKKFKCHSKSVLKLNSRMIVLKNVFQNDDFRQKKSRFETPHWALLESPAENPEWKLILSSKAAADNEVTTSQELCV